MSFLSRLFAAFLEKKEKKEKSSGSAASSSDGPNEELATIFDRLASGAAKKEKNKFVMISYRKVIFFHGSLSDC
jgi:hypothetical protein